MRGNGPKAKHSKAVKTADRLQKLEEVIELIAKGNTQQRIAKILGVSQQTVSLLWQAAKELARERAAQGAQEILDQEFRQLDVLREKLWKAWDMREGEAGDAAVAGQLLKVHERICKLKGLDVERVKVDGDFRVAGKSVDETDELMLERLRILTGERGSKGNGSG